MKPFYKKFQIILMVLFPYTLFCSEPDAQAATDTHSETGSHWFLYAKLKFSDATTLFSYARVRFGGKIRMFQSDHPLLKKNNISLGYNFEIGNNYLETGPMIVFSPVLFFDLTVKTYLHYGWKILPFNNVNDPIYQSDLNRAEANAIKATGTVVMITPEIKLQFGPVVILNEFDFYYMKVNKTDVFYNARYDHLQQAGFNICNAFTLGFIISRHFGMGISSAYVKVLQTGYEKLGLTAAFIFYNLKWISKNDEIQIQIGYWIKDKYRYNDDNAFKGLIAWLSYKIDFEF